MLFKSKNAQASEQKNNFRAWKSGKKWLYTAAALTIIAGGSAVTSHSASAWNLNPLTWFGGGEETDTCKKLNDLFQKAQSCRTALENDVKGINDFSASIKVKAEALSDPSIVANKDYNTQQARFNALKETVANYQKLAIGVSFKQKVKDYQKAINAYNEFIDDNDIQIPENLRNILSAINPELAHFNYLVSQYSNKMNAYLDHAQKVLIENKISVDFPEIVKNIDSSLDKINDVKAKFADALAKQAADASKHDFKTEQEANDNLAKVKADGAEITKLLAEYKAAYTTYLNTAKAYNDKLDGIPGYGDKKLPDLTGQFTESFSNAVKNSQDNINVAASNTNIAIQNLRVPGLKGAFQEWKNELAALNEAQKAVKSIADSFPYNFAEKTADYSLANLNSWKYNKFDGAMAKLSAEIKKAGAAEKKYQDALTAAGMDTPVTPSAWHLHPANALEEANKYYKSVTDWAANAVDQYKVGIERQNSAHGIPMTSIPNPPELLTLDACEPKVNDSSWKQGTTTASELATGIKANISVLPFRSLGEVPSDVAPTLSTNQVVSPDKMIIPKA